MKKILTTVVVIVSGLHAFAQNKTINLEDIWKKRVII